MSSATTESHFSGAAMLTEKPVHDRGAEAAARESTTAPARYTIRLFDTLAEVKREEWDAVVSAAPNPTFMDYRFAGAVEAALKDTWRFWFAVVYDGAGAPVACAGLTSMKIDFTDFGDPRVTWIAKYLPFMSRFRNMKILFCSLPGSPGDRSLAMVPNADSAQVLRLLDERMTQLATEAGLDGIIFKEFSPPDLDRMSPMTSMGYSQIEIPAMHLLDPAFKSFAEYTAALRTRYRQQVTKATRKLKGSGIDIKVMTDTDEILRYYTPQAHAMYAEMTLKSDLRVEVLPIEYYQELVRRMPGQAELIALLKDDRLIGIGWCLHDAVTYHMMYAGVDYTISRDYDLYFNLMYMGFDRALSRGVQRIHVGQTATTFKSRMGCHSEERYIYTKGVGFFMQNVFRFGAPFMVIKKPSNPPNDIFKRPNASPNE
jgi:predicted N-acyltransferase